MDIYRAIFWVVWVVVLYSWCKRREYSSFLRAPNDTWPRHV